MATQICPKCKEDTFTWSIDDETSLTKWGYYSAIIVFEGETFERVCLTCLTKTEIKTEIRTEDKQNVLVV